MKSAVFQSCTEEELILLVTVRFIIPCPIYNQCTIHLLSMGHYERGSSIKVGGGEEVGKCRLKKFVFKQIYINMFSCVP